MKFSEFKDLFEPTYKLNRKTNKSFLLETTKDISKEYKKRDISFTDTKMKLHWNGNSWNVSTYYSKELEKYNLRIIVVDEDNTSHNIEDDIINNLTVDNTSKSTENINMNNIIMTSMLCSAIITPILSSLSSK
jgi:hypothetical protein